MFSYKKGLPIARITTNKKNSKDTIIRLDNDDKKNKLIKHTPNMGVYIDQFNDNKNSIMEKIPNIEGRSMLYSWTFWKW